MPILVASNRVVKENRFLKKLFCDEMVITETVNIFLNAYMQLSILHSFSPLILLSLSGRIFVFIWVDEKTGVYRG